jgi:hypothetical protein
MVYEPDAADALAVALVTAMIDRFGAGHRGSQRQTIQIAQMTRDTRRGEVDLDDYIGALGVLAARVIEDVAMLSGEPVALWLERWIADPYGSPAKMWLGLLRPGLASERGRFLRAPLVRVRSRPRPLFSPVQRSGSVASEGRPAGVSSSGRPRPPRPAPALTPVVACKRRPESPFHRRAQSL